MIPRMTTVGLLKNYRYDLNRSNVTMSKSLNTVLTKRLFNSYAEDPALATRCFQLRRSYQRTASQLTVNDSLVHKYDVAWKAKLTASEDIYALADDTAFGSIIRAENGATAGGRNALGQSLTAKAKDLVQTLNGRYGENYVFSGADTQNVPFTWDGPRINPHYVNPDSPGLKDANGKPVDSTAEDKYAAAFKYIADPALAGQDADKNDMKYTNNPDLAVQVPEENPDYNPKRSDIDGKYLKPDGSSTNKPEEANKVPKENPSYREDSKYKYLDQGGKGTNLASAAERTGICFRGVPVDSNDPSDVKQMEFFLNETKYIDVGLGHKEQDGEAISSSVFNCALQGVYYTGGYGTTTQTVTADDGSTHTVQVPNNMISVIDRLGTILQRCDSDDGKFASKDDEIEARALAQQFEDKKDLYIQRWTELDSEASFLKDNSELLTGTADSLTEQYQGLEDVDPAAAIMDYMYARYCYDTALKVGNSVLPQSLMDYMSF